MTTDQLLSSTVMTEVADTLVPPMEKVPVMVAVPSARAVTTPEELTVATDVELLDHVALPVTVLVESADPPKDVVRVMARDCVSPTSRVAEDGVTPAE